MVFNIKYLFCLSILLSLFKPRARTEMITATAQKKPLIEINRKVMDVKEYITNPDKSFEALSSHLLTAEESYSLCKAFYVMKDLGNTLAWSMETLRKYKEETTEEHSFTEVDVLEYIAYVHYLMDDMKNALEWTKKLLKLDPNHPRAAGNVPQYEDIIAGQEIASQYREETGDETEDEKANAIKPSEDTHELNVAKIHFMTATDCYELTQLFYNKKDYNHSLVWSMETLRKYKEETTEEHSFTQVDVLEYIAYTHYLMGDFKTALKWTKELLTLDPYHPRAVGNVPLYEEAIAKGKLPQAMDQFDVAKSLQMTAADCFELGKALYHKSEYNNSLAWNMESLRKYKNETTEEHSFPEVDLLEYIAYTHYLIGDIKPALEWTKKLLKLDPIHPRAVANVPYYEKMIADKEGANEKRGDTGDECEDETNEDETNEDETNEDETEEVPEFDIAKSRLMTADGCFNLCQGFYFNNDFNNSLAWGMEALHKYKEETGKKHSFTEVEVLEYIAFSHNMLGDLKPALDWTKKLLKLDPNHPRAAGNVPIYEKAIAEQEAVTKKRWGTGVRIEDEKDEKAKPGQIISDVDGLSLNYPEIKLRYEALCRGEMEINSYVAKRLFCRYMSETHPFLRLAPIKAEQVYIDPDVFVFHGVLSDDEIQSLKVLSMPRLQRATLGSDTAIGETVVNDYRISKSAWLSDQESQVVARVSQRVADMTGLSMESAEELQVVNYGIGGHYEPHFDFAKKNKLPFSQQDGNRIATVLFYMSDVVQGGTTVFTELGLSVHPERGAALFFMNLHPSGEGDSATRHGACPVLRGSKWVCNKWIHEGGQELTKPCSWSCQIEETIRMIPRAARAPI